MRKRFISGLTAVCMLGILLANSFLAVPASAVIAEVGASVAAGLLMGTLFNQMTGGTGYDFTDAFSDCFMISLSVIIPTLIYIFRTVLLTMLTVSM